MNGVPPIYADLLNMTDDHRRLVRRQWYMDTVGGVAFAMRTSSTSVRKLRHHEYFLDLAG